MIASDSMGYARLGFSAAPLPAAIFLKRPPLYPLLVAPFIRTGWLTGLFLLQSLLTAMSCVAVVVAVRRLWPWAANLAAVALVAHATYTVGIIQDWALLSESVFTSLLRFAIAGVVLWCATRRVAWLFAAAGATAAAAGSSNVVCGAANLGVGLVE